MGVAPPNRCDGVIRLHKLPSGTWFLGCTKYDRQRGHHFFRVPPTVNVELLGTLIDDPSRMEAADGEAASCLFMESRWARLRTCPLDTNDTVTLVPAGDHPDGTCPVSLRLYTFSRPVLQQYTILMLNGTHTHPRAFRTIRRGELRSRVFDL